MVEKKQRSLVQHEHHGANILALEHLPLHFSVKEKEFPHLFSSLYFRIAEACNSADFRCLLIPNFDPWMFIVEPTGWVFFKLQTTEALANFRIKGLSILWELYGVVHKLQVRTEDLGLEQMGTRLPLEGPGKQALLIDLISGPKFLATFLVSFCQDSTSKRSKDLIGWAKVTWLL